MAHRLLAVLSEGGNGLPVDLAKAVQTYRVALGAGVILASHDLARLLWSGDGIERDRATAMVLFRRAAAAGIPWSHERLAQLHLIGDGVDKSNLDALYHYALATRLFEEAGYADDAVRTRVMQANLAQMASIRELQEVLRRIQAWTPSAEAPRKPRD